MSSSIVELIAGNGITIDANETNDTIILSSTGGLSTDELNKIKNLEEYIRRISLLANNGLIIDKSSTYKIPIDGKYEIRLCGGGASGSGSWSYSSGTGSQTISGCGGNSGYLVNKELALVRNAEITIIIGAGGVFDVSNNKGNNGSDTKVIIHGETYIAKGGETIVTPITTSARSIHITPSEPWNGYSGSTVGGDGCEYVSSSGSYGHGQYPAGNGQFGAMGGGSTSGRSGGGGGGGVIVGKITAGSSYDVTSAIGYGAGGAGSMYANTPTGKNDKRFWGGDGAQGAVQIKYLGNE